MMTLDELEVGSTRAVFVQGSRAEAQATFLRAKRAHPRCSWKLLDVDAETDTVLGVIHYWVD